MDNIFLQISALLGITVSVAFFVRLLKQPLMIAYIIAGIVAGPLVLNFMHGDNHMFDAFSEFGIVLLLFVVGLSLNIDHIKKIGKVSFATGILQFLFTSIVGILILLGLNFSLMSAVYIGIALTFSSTIIVVKLLNDKKDSQSVYGRHIIGLMVVQDLIAIALMIIINTFSQQGDLAKTASILGLKFLALLGFVYVLARYVLPKILDHVAKSSEFLFIFTIAWCFGVASLLHWIGFSIEVGALIAGLSLGSSPYQPEIASRIRPLRDFFIVLFFVILGSRMQIADLGTALLPAVILSLFVLIGDPFILFSSFRALKFTRRNSFLAGVTAAHVSEFGFVLLFLGMQAGFVTENDISIFTLVALITIFFSSYAITYNEQMYRMFMPVFTLFGKDKYQQPEEEKEPYTVWVFGYHRIGWKVCEALIRKKIRFAVVDFDPKAVERLNNMGIPAYFGDAADVEFLETLQLEKAKLVVSTLPEPDDQITLVKFIRSKTDKTYIVTNLYHINHLEDLYEAGASYVMMPHLMGGHWMAEVLSSEAWTKKTFDALKKEQKEEMRMRVVAQAYK